jgi:hypothetical protein
VVAGRSTLGARSSAEAVVPLARHEWLMRERVKYPVLVRDLVAEPV